MTSGNNLAEFLLSSLQPGNRGWSEVGGGLYVCADGGNSSAAEIVGAENLFLSAVFSVVGDGASTGGSAERRGLADVARHRNFGSLID